MLATNEKGMYPAYSDIVLVSIKKGLTGSQMDVLVSDDNIIVNPQRNS
jgi:citrate lyase alpha subunit